MKMQNVEMEFVTFDAQDVIATSGPVPGYVGTYYVEKHGDGNYALYDEETHAIAPTGTNPNTAHTTWLNDGGKFYTNPEKQGSYEESWEAYFSKSHYEFYQLSDDLYYWLKRVDQ